MQKFLESSTYIDWHHETVRDLAAHLGKTGWYRIDPRGNKPGIDAQFTPPVEQLAFELSAGEEDICGYWNRPSAQVVHALTQHRDVNHACQHLPDSVGSGQT